MPRLCLNLLNSLPFPSEERPEAFQQLHSLSPSRGAHCLHSTRGALCPCSPPSSQDISTSQHGHTLSPLECFPSDARAIALHSPYLSLSGPFSERSPHVEACLLSSHRALLDGIAMPTLITIITIYFCRAHQNIVLRPQEHHYYLF